MTVYSHSADQTYADGAIPVYQASTIWQAFSSAGSAQVKTGHGSIDAIITGTAGMTVALYDNTSATGTPIVTLTPAVGYTPIRIQFLVGLFAVVTGTGNITITAR